MNGVKSGGILTDICASIESGIWHVLGPETVHRYCSWHILHKLPTKWGNVSDKVNEKRSPKSDKVKEQKFAKSDNVKEKKSAKSDKVK